MKRFFKIPALLACAALLICPASNTFAQPKPAQPVPTRQERYPKPAADAPKVSDPWQRRLPELQFDNVPLSEVANFLSDQFPEINFVLHPAVKDMPVLLKLRSVTLDDIFAALDIATSPATGSAVDPATGLPIAGGLVQINKLTDRMVSFSLRQASTAEATKPVCRAFSLARYLAGKSDAESEKALKEVEDALSRCWKMLEAADRSSTRAETPQLSLHRSTKLLIVVGQPSQVDVVAQVVSQLEEKNSEPMAQAIDPTTGLPIAPGSPSPYRMPGVPSTPKPPGGR